MLISYWIAVFTQTKDKIIPLISELKMKSNIKFEHKTCISVSQMF
jgi:hypothetical protein